MSQSASLGNENIYVHPGDNGQSISLSITNIDDIEIEGILVWIYANSQVVHLTGAQTHEAIPIDTTAYSFFHNSGMDIDGEMIVDTLKLSLYCTQDCYIGPGGDFFNIQFNVTGELGDSTSIEIVRFELDSLYIQNTTSIELFIIPEQNCENVDACNYESTSIAEELCNTIENCEYYCDLGTIYYEDSDGDGLGNPYVSQNSCEPIYGYVTNSDDDDDVCEGTISPIDGSCCLSSVFDECGVCNGNNYESICIGTDDCIVMDCTGDCNGDESLTPCGDCSDVSSCNFSVGIATLNNNFRSDNIAITISFNDFEGFSQLSTDTQVQGFEGMEFTVSFNSELLEINSSNSLALIENMSYTFSENTPGEINWLLYHTGNEALFQSIDGPIVNLSFDVIESKYISDLHGRPTDIEILLNSLNSVDISAEEIKDMGTLTIYTKACIDPFASTIDSNFICDVYEDVCDENGILEGSHIFNDGCILPEPDFEDVLSGWAGDEELILQLVDTYTLIIPEGTVITFPEGETSLDIISSDSVDINFFPDVAPGAQLAGSLVGLYPFGTTFDPPIEFIFNFTDLSRGTHEYKILFMDDIQTGDWEEIGTCSGEALGLCEIEDLDSSGLFIVMYGENLSINEFEIPTKFNLYRSYPNPFNPITTLEFDIENSGVVNFMVYNISGQIVESILPKFYTPGNYQVKWEARDIPTGIYLIQMRTESSVHLQKVMLLK